MMDKSAYIASIVCELKRVRRCANLTQEEVAERMHTKQAAIARMEKDARGSFSLKRIADYALACGYAPCSFMSDPYSRYLPEFHCVPLEEARQMIIEDPQGNLTWHKYVQWKAQKILEEMGPPQQYIQTNMLHFNRYVGEPA